MLELPIMMVLIFLKETSNEKKDYSEHDGTHSCNNSMQLTDFHNYARSKVVCQYLKVLTCVVIYMTVNLIGYFDFKSKIIVVQ